MDRASYDAFAADLTAALEARPEVLGLVAAGSFASGPDEWSDHDFLVIASPSATAALRADPSWLPHHERLVLHFRETAHGMKGVYDDGHLVEYAVFAPDEIAPPGSTGPGCCSTAPTSRRGWPTPSPARPTWRRRTPSPTTSCTDSS